jgi:hypothetical protein
MPARNENSLCVPDVAVVERLYLVKPKKLGWEVRTICCELLSVAAILRCPWLSLVCEVRCELADGRRHLTRKSSAAAGGSERGLQWMCFHKSGGTSERPAVSCSDWLDGLRSISLRFLLLVVSEMTVIHEDATWWLLTRSDLDKIKRAILREPTCVCKGEDAQIPTVLCNNANL